jgi:hypothetical protein
MRFYPQQHRLYAGIDLPARTMHRGVLDPAGTVVCDRNLPCPVETRLPARAPFRDHLLRSWSIDEHARPFSGSALALRALLAGNECPHFRD